MKSGFIVGLLIALLMVSVYAEDKAPAPKETKPGRKVPADPLEHKTGDDLLEQLQGGNSDVFIIIFYINKEEADKLKGKIDSDIIQKGRTYIRSTMVDLTKIKDYYKLFKVLKLEGEPKRGHTEPLVLVMSKGEGFVIRGPNIVEGILNSKRIDKVESGTIFGQSGNTPDTISYPYGG